jgi:hypothetical protein
MTTNLQEFTKLYATLVEKTWDDPGFLAILLQNPSRTLAASGLITVPNSTVNIVLRKLDRNAKLAEQLALWEDGNRSGVYDIIIPIKPDPSAVLIPEGGEAGCCCCPCCCCGKI